MQDNELTFADRALFAKVASLMVEGFILNGNQPAKDNPGFEAIYDMLNDPELTIMETLAELIPRWERFRDFPEEAFNQLSSAEAIGSMIILNEVIKAKGLSKTSKKLVERLSYRLQLALLAEETTDNGINLN